MRAFAARLVAIGTVVILPGSGAAAAPPTGTTALDSWTGFYSGFNVGWNWAGTTTSGVANTTPQSSTPTLSFPTATLPFTDFTPSNGAIGGFQAGYNLHTPSNWIVGLEADIQALRAGATSNPQSANFGFEFATVLRNITVSTISENGTVSHTDSLSWLGTVRPRLGYVVRPNIMVYATGGLAYGRVSESLSASSSATFAGPGFGRPTIITGIPDNVAFSTSTTKIGWTAGGGFSGFVPNTRLTWKAEYLYVDLGTYNYSYGSPASGIGFSSKVTDNIVRIGLDYHL